MFIPPFLLQSSNTDKDYAVKEVEGLFYHEPFFNKVVKIGVGVVAGLVFVGLVWEFSYRRQKHSGKLQLEKKGDAKETATELTLLRPDRNSKSIEQKKEELLLSYNKFHERWMDALLKTKS